MSRRLLYLVHADPSVAPMYRSALPPEVDVVPFIAPPLAGVPGGGMSSRYAALGQQLKLAHGGSVLPGLFAKYPPPQAASSYEAVYMATWSAGYALPRVFSAADRAQCAGLVLLDSGHTDKDPDGTARDAGVAWAVEWAQLARDMRKLLWIGHTDVQTYGTTASTTQFAQEVERLAGGQQGLFRVKAHDVSKDQQVEHMAALRDWGPAFVRDALAADALDAESTEPTLILPQPLTASDFGIVVLSFAKEDLNAGLREIGHNAGRMLEELYLKPLGLKPGDPYCAAFVSSCIRRAEKATGLKSPVAGSPGAKAIRDQFVKAGLFVPASKLTKADFVPGAVPVYDRSKPGPGELDYRGHIGILVDSGVEDYWNIEGNADQGRETDAVSMVPHKMFGDPDLLGLGFFSPRLTGVA